MSKLVGGSLRILLCLGLLGLAAGCSDNGSNNPDGSTGKEGGLPPDSGVKPTLKCKADKSDCKDFVVNGLIMPTTQTSKQLAFDLDGKGGEDNALGAILGALAGVSKDLALQASVDAALWKGETIVLFRIQAADFANDPSAVAQAWVGEKADCCPTNKNDPDPNKCKTEADGTCFKGDYSFKPAAASPTDATFNGTISGGKFKFGPAVLALQLPLTSAGTLDVTLRSAQFKGTLSGTTISDGVLGGAITKDELDNRVLPAVANLLNTTLNDPNSSQTTKDQIANLFDKNKDKKIDIDEVKNNDLIQTFLAGDIDIDNDGKLELSLGVGFTGTGAVVNN